jgi:hypothetical protein
VTSPRGFRRRWTGCEIGAAGVAVTARRPDGLAQQAVLEFQVCRQRRHYSREGFCLPRRICFEGCLPRQDSYVIGAPVRIPKKFLWLGAGVTAMAALAGLATVPAASADTGALTLCSQGGYGSYAQWPDRGDFSTFVIPNGQCYTSNVGGNTNEDIDIYDACTNQLIGSTIYNGSVGETIVTIAGPSFYAYNG